jgi:hypothetical protein
MFEKDAAFKVAECGRTRVRIRDFRLPGEFGDEGRVPDPVDVPIPHWLLSPYG